MAGAWVEVRTINGRYFKLSAKCLDGIQRRSSPTSSSVVRRQIRRGSVQVTLRVERPRTAEAGGINIGPFSTAIVREVKASLFQRWQVRRPVPYGALLALPGVVAEQAVSPGASWPRIGR